MAQRALPYGKRKIDIKLICRQACALGVLTLFGQKLPVNNGVFYEFAGKNMQVLAVLLKLCKNSIFVTSCGISSCTEGQV
jgi:hypothetical protein